MYWPDTTMKKTLRRTQSKGRSRANVPTQRRAVTRGEYAEVVVRLGAVELQMQRNRADIDLQAQRIAQLQEQLRAIPTALPAQTVSKEMPPLPIATTAPAVES